MSRITIQRIELGKVQLDALPQADREFFALIAHAANEVGILSRLLLNSVSTKTPSLAEQDVLWGQTFLLLKLTASKLTEAWGRFRDLKVKTSLAADRSYLDKSGAAALKRLETCFSKDNNPLTEVRNSFGSHYDLRTTRRGLAALSHDDKSYLYVTSPDINCYMHFGDLVSTLAFAKSSDRAEYAIAMRSLMTDIMSLAVDFHRVAVQTIVVIYDRHVGGTPLEGKTRRLNVRQSRPRGAPLFIDFDDPAPPN